ncbi:MAG: YHYH protein [Myxococcota bacterium]
MTFLKPRAATWTLVMGLLGCGDSAPVTDAAADGTEPDGGTDAGMLDAGEGVSFPACPSDIWAGLDDLEDVGELSACPEEELRATSLFQLTGVTIDNNGEAMVPCIAARCSDEFAYVATNSIPHYDFVQTTPNELVENLVVYRVPRTPSFLAATAVDDAAGFTGCVDGYEQHIASPGNATPTEPSGLCANTGETLYFENLSGGRVDYQAIPCLGTAAFLISGTSANAPNEAGFPDPWGNPAATLPDTAADALGALDLCGGHTGGDMHYHSVAGACFARDASGAPANSYVAATEDWNLEAELTGACTEESPIVGWSLDGYPIKGPCVCLARDDAGICTDVRRAYSSWVYEGLGSWEAESEVSSEGALDLEGMACEDNSDCADEDYRCTWALRDDGDDVVAAKQCVLIDYGWCSHRYAERTTDRTDRVFLDRCNGVEDADGYAHRTTMSFPYILGCYRGAPAEQAARGMMMGGGMGVAMCGGGLTEMCCGDGVCGGPETADNCPDDC